MWNVATHQQVAVLNGHTNFVESVSCVAFSPDGTLLASGSLNGTVRLWDVETHEQLIMFTDHTDCVWSVAFSPDGTLLASGSYDKTVRLWNVAMCEKVAVINSATDDGGNVVFSPNGTMLASGSADKTVRLWSMWPIVQRKLQIVASAFLQHGRLSPYTLLHIIDRVMGRQDGRYGDCFGARKVNWLFRLQKKLHIKT